MTLLALIATMGAAQQNLPRPDEVPVEQRKAFRANLKAYEKQAKANEAAGFDFWLDGISDEYLELVYGACNCLIAASYGEGFGLPLIESAQHRLPVMARDIPVFREVAGPHAYYFSATEPEQLAQAVRDWLNLYQREQHPTSEKMPWLTWQQSAQVLLQKIMGVN